MASLLNFTGHLKNKHNPSQAFPKKIEEVRFSNPFSEVSFTVIQKLDKDTKRK